jgi:predicted nucleic acid-binding protein
MVAILDTSVIVRYLTDDPPGSADLAGRLIEGDEDLLVPEVVLTEVGYVLASLYHLARERVVDLMLALLRRTNIEPLFLDKATVMSALLLCRPSNRVSYTDALTWASARAARTHVVYTLDERFPREGLKLKGLES